jgi:hypothetical protein
MFFIELHISGNKLLLILPLVMDNLGSNEKDAGGIINPEQKHYEGSQRAINRPEFRNRSNVPGKKMLCYFKKNCRKKGANESMGCFDFAFWKKDVKCC